MRPKSAYFGPIGRLVLVICAVLSILMLTVRVQRSIHDDQVWGQRSQKVVSVIAASLMSRPPQDHERWLATLSDATGRLIMLIDDENALPAQFNHESHQQTMVETRHHDNVRSFVAHIPNTRAYLQIDVPQDPASFATLLAQLIRWDLESLNEADQRIRLRWLSAKLSLPVHFEQSSDTALPQDELAPGGASINDEGVIGVSRGRDTVIVGPLSVIHGWLWHHLVIAVLLAGCVGLGLGIYLFRPYQRQLKAMSLAAQDISRGVLDTRVSEDTTTDWVYVSKSFNRMAQQVEELLSIQQEMLSAVSHELRTPVARIRFGLEMIQDMTDDSLAPFFSGLDADIEELDRLIDEIITYAKLHRGQPNLQFRELDIDALLQQVRAEAEQLGSGISVIYEPSIQPARDRIAEGEERYIHRVVQNFTNNALRHAHSKVRLRFEMTEQQCLIRVCDDGPGIPLQDRERIFSPFTRLDDSRTRSSGGYGLGLSIVRRIADWHQGDVEVQTSEWGGASFVFVWPRFATRKGTKDSRLSAITIPRSS